jgi:hypothetical protein
MSENSSNYSPSENSKSDNSSNTNTDSNINESFITDNIKCEGCEFLYCNNCKFIKLQLIDKFCNCRYNCNESTDMEIEQ